MPTRRRHAPTASRARSARFRSFGLRGPFQSRIAFGVTSTSSSSTIEAPASPIDMRLAPMPYLPDGAAPSAPPGMGDFVAHWFKDDPSTPGSRVWRRSSGPAIASGVAAVFIGCLGLGGVGFGLTLVSGLFGPGGWPIGLFMLAMAAFMLGLAAYCWRDMKGKRGATIALDETNLTLRLPGGRSLIENPPPCRATMPLADVAAVEMRLQVYRTLGMAMMQRAYRLRRRSGPPIFLFEERALGTRIAETSMLGVAEEIATRAGVPLDDLGMAEGRAGVLGMWFARPPAWSAAALPADRQARLWRRVGLTGGLVGLAALVVLLARVLR